MRNTEAAPDDLEDETPGIQRACAECGPLGSCPGCEDDETIQRATAFPEIPNLSAESEEQPNAPPEAVPAVAGEAAPAEGGEAGEGQKAGKNGKPGSRVKLPQIPPVSALPEEEPPIQTQSEGHEGGTDSGGVAPSLARTLGQSKGSGQRMDARTQGDMEQNFGRDFSDVRIHTGGDAPEMNRRLNARAFTHRADIYFNNGEYQPESDSGKRLLAHELTHTAQQGATGDRIQRFTAPQQDVVLEPRPDVPSDGDEVTGRMNEKIENDPDVQDADDASDEEREEAEHPNRAEVRGESNAIETSGESHPSVDRGADASETTGEQQALIDEQVEAQANEAGEEEAGEEGEKAELSAADAAAQAAEAAEQAAASVEIPEQPEPFRHPRIEAPVDSAGEPLPRNAPIDTQVRGLGYIGEMLREQGYQMKHHAAELEVGSYGLDAVLEREREDLANAMEGTATIEGHNEARQEIAAASHEAHTESVERQQFVAAHAPDLANKADEGKADSSELASEARSKADKSQSEIPDDEDARADAEQQSGEMGETAQGAESMDQAITQTGERARQYEQDAAQAAEENQQSEAQITAADEIIAQTDERVVEMHGMNAASQAQIEGAAAGPSTIRRFALQTAQSGDELIGATIVMEGELISIQDTYLAEMAAIESREAAAERVQREQEEASQSQLSPEDQTLIELAGLSEEDQQARMAQMDQTERDALLAALDRMMAQTPDEGAAPEAAASPQAAGGRTRVDTGLAKAIMGEQPPDPRAPEIHQVEQHRVERVGGVLDVADQNMTFLDAEQQRMLASRLVAESISDDIGAINVLQMGKEMLKGLIDPRMALVGAIGGFEKVLGGLANIGNWEAWRKDPLGNLLQIAADITTGLATIFSSILGIAGLITAVMVALTIVSWGFLSWFTFPVIGWMGTIMTYAGWGALITGALAVYFNYLCYIKNLHDAGTADTARELFSNTEEMKQNCTDGFQGAMAVVEGVAAVKMGPKLSSGEIFQHIPRSPGAWARQTVQGAREGLAAIASAPGRLATGARRLLSGGREGLMRFKERIQRFVGRHADEAAPPATPHARRTHDADLAEARGQRLDDMDEAPRRAELAETARSQPRHVEPGSEFHRDYDVQIEANGHTYRRRRDGKGWCRFSGEGDCGIGDSNLPPEVRDRVSNLAPPTRTHTLDKHQQSIVDEIEADLQANGLTWEDIGVQGRGDVDRFLGQYPDPDDGLVALGARADQGIDFAEAVPRRQTQGDPGSLPSEAIEDLSTPAKPPGGITRGTPEARERPRQNKIKGDIAEARHAAEVSPDRPPRPAQQVLGRRRYQDLLDDLRERRKTLRQFAEALPPEGAQQVRIRVPDDPRSRVTSRYVDHMYIDGDQVVLRESKDLTKMDIDSNQKLREQVDRDLWIARNNPGVVVEWRIDGVLTPEAQATFRLLMQENPGIFRVTVAGGAPL